MSSSIFTETNIQEKSGLGEDKAASANSNLVVVYSKRGVNFDRKGLESLIEEKSLSSISIIRLTSPTPSMENEEEIAEKLEETLRKQELHSEEDSSNDSIKELSTDDTEKIQESEEGEGEDEQEQEEEANIDISNEDESLTESEDDFNIKLKEKIKNFKAKRLSKNNNFNYKSKKKNSKERPEIVGLTVEEFYPPNIAKEVARNVLKAAGLPIFKSTAEYEFLMYVINNDHCYTPFTSPEQMKAKLEADKLEAEKRAALFAGRKGMAVIMPSIKQQTFKRSVSQIPNEKKDEVKAILSSAKFPEVCESGSNEITDTSDNDRDSHLNLHSRNMKFQIQKTLSSKNGNFITLTKSQSNCPQQNWDSNVYTTPKPTKVISNTLLELVNSNKSSIIQSIKPNTVNSSPVLKINPDSHKVSPSVSKSVPVVSVSNTTPTFVHQIQSTINSNSGFSKRVGTQNMPQVRILNDIKINKIIAIPKRGFTEISSLISKQNEDDGSSSTSGAVTKTVLIDGKAPFKMENDELTKKALQTEQNLTDFEKNKQLDLIDSFVKNEMIHSNEIIEHQTKSNDNIPKLVKMLESAEETIEVIDSLAETDVDRIGISNNALLNNMPAEEEIPEDLIQDVVQLIKDDKTLQEAVEKEVFGKDSIETSNIIDSTTTPIVLPSTQEKPDYLQGIQNKSIIQIAITNTISETPSTKEVTNSAERTPKNQKISEFLIHDANTERTPTYLETMTSADKEPVKVVRGNGRVITLPPIEAPNTRAKRRLQTQPTNITSKSKIQNSSLNTSSTESILSDHSADSSLIENKLEETSFDKHGSKEDSTAGTLLATGRAARRSSVKRSASSQKSLANNSAKDKGTSDVQDDDDPKKLWCICRQPHNNRFMICCDVCEDWFHGTCVNVTKAMGIEMEQNRIEWTCPSCVKKAEDKKQKKITDMFMVHPNSNIEKSEVAKVNNAVPLDETHKLNVYSDTNRLISNKASSFISEVHKKNEIQTKNISCTPTSHKKQKLSKKTILTSPMITSGQKKYFAPSNIKNTVKTTPPHIKADSDSNVLSHKMANQQHKKIMKSAQETSSQISKIEEKVQCIVCKKSARPNSIYCGDDCIRKHVQQALQTFFSKPSELPTNTSVGKKIEEKKKGLFEEFLSMADRKPRVERVNVFERKSGRLLTGSNAPTTAGLKRWLQDNPTFEVVQPGSLQAIDIEKKQKNRNLNSTSPIHNKMAPIFSTSSHTLSNSGTGSAYSPVKQTASVTVKKYEPEFIDFEKTHLHRQMKTTLEQEKYKELRPNNTPKQSPKNQSPSKLTKLEKPSKSEVRDDSKIRSQNKQKIDSNDPELTRSNVRRTLKDLLLQRVKDLTNDISVNSNTSPQLTAEEIEQFAVEIEAELFTFFNRDTGTKYKSKYRSIAFNIRDPKNSTLITKINAKLIEAKQLVRMSPEEMASQELAQWRENEVKHQLEIIKKSELDMLSSSKNYVLKSHKGEEVIEAKESLELDHTVVAEELSSVLNNSTELLNKCTEASELSLPVSSLTLNNAHGENSKLNIPNKEKMKEKERDREKHRSSEHEKSHDRERRHRSKDRYRDKSKSRKRSPTRSRSRGESHIIEKKHKSLHKEDHRDKDEKTREKEHYIKKDKKDSNRRLETERKLDKKPSLTITMMSKTEKDNTHIDTSTTTHKQTANKSVESFNIVDQILESTKTVEEAANLKSHKDSCVTIKSSASCTESTTSTTAAIITSQNYIDSDQEPTSTVSFTTPPQDPYIRYSGSNDENCNKKIWNGSITMIDLTSFHGILQPVVGNTLNLGNFLTEELDIIGRIRPETVWDYISKIKRSPNKEIVIVSLMPSNESETAAYSVLYKYLDERERLGVIKVETPQIKDFYLFPLGSGKAMPLVLQPFENVEFYEDLYRPDLLIGIIIRVIGKRTFLPLTSKTMVSQKAAGSESLTPPGSPKRKKLPQVIAVNEDEIDLDAIIRAPITSRNQNTIKTATVKVDDSNEPYSPGGSSDDDARFLTVKPSPSDDDLKRKMDELNRQIAAQELEIAGLLNVEQTRIVSSSPSSSSVLSKISIPSNLSQILASIQKKSATSGSQDGVSSTVDTEEYNPLETNYSSYKKEKTSTSRLAQLSEEELLSMVPDNMIDQTLASSQQPFKEKKKHCEEPPPPGV